MGYLGHLGGEADPDSLVAAAHQLLHFGWPHRVTEAMHSFVVVGVLLAGAWLLWRAAVPFLVGMLAHGAADFLTHGRWPYNHLFPLPVEPVTSPVSYTDTWFTVLEHALVLAFLVWWLWRRSPDPARAP